jgi:hypothetical protein
VVQRNCLLHLMVFILQSSSIPSKIILIHVEKQMENKACIRTLLQIFMLLFLSKTAFAQSDDKPGGKDFTEPIFEDNTGEFYGEPGSFEFNFVPVLVMDKGEGLLELGGEIETNIAPKLGAELGFSHSWLEFGDEAFARQEYTFLEFGLQYLLGGNRNRLLAVGAETRTPSLTALTDGEATAWVTEPFMLLACQFGGKFNGQFRPSLELAWQGGSPEMELGFTGSVFRQGDVFLFGLEAGISMGEEEGSLSFAPQMGFETGAFDVGFGINMPFQLTGGGSLPPYLLARIVYELELKD